MFQFCQLVASACCWLVIYKKTAAIIGERITVMSVGWASVRAHVSGTLRPNYSKYSVYVAYSYGRGSGPSGGIAARYVLPVSWITLCFPTVGPMAVWSYGSSFAATCVWTSTPAARYWLRPLLDDDGLQAWTSPSVLRVRGVGRSMRYTIALRTQQNNCSEFYKVLE